ncbi:CoA transferase [Rudaeicoccus suwonensis]|uniref:CoA transferase family III n=1 Tax=Rudaeicoccus suwonensis TaxID=657409 RepID=A0A561E3U3_9MICO|nr:CoA transferase [Rudaeicoccus suwonensis]TWE10269.1 CoA transferase family III [Rudaeicoccus suwonensis]
MTEEPLAHLLRILDLEDAGAAHVLGDEPETGSPHLLGKTAAAAMAAHGVASVEFARLRGGPARSVTVRTEDAILQLMAAFGTRIGRVPMVTTMEDPNLLGDSGFYRCADGREIFVLLSFPHLRDRALAVLGCPPNRAAITAAVARWRALDLEEAINAVGGTATMVRSSEEWQQSEAGRAIAETPAVSVERIGAAPSRVRGALGVVEPPLSGIRVLDLTHVIAGPVAARLVAELGADVLHLSRPDRPDPNAMIIETGAGKRNAFCDLRVESDREEFEWALAQADVVIHGYRHLERFGIDAASLAQRHPGLVVADVHGWGPDGPWGDRGGFDQLACSATGFAFEEGGDHASLPPTYLLNDYVAAFLLSAGVSAALARQLQSGGSWRVHVDLARVCTWVQSFGLLAGRTRSGDLRERLNDVELVSRPGPFGDVRTLPSFVAVDPPWESTVGTSAPLGSSPLCW